MGQHSLNYRSLEVCVCVSVCARLCVWVCVCARVDGAAAGVV